MPTGDESFALHCFKAFLHRPNIVYHTLVFCNSTIACFHGGRIPAVQTHIFHQFEKTYSFIKLNQSIVFNKLYLSMVPTGKSNDVLHI